MRRADHTNWAYSVCFSPDGCHAVSTGDDHVARVYALPLWTCVASCALPNAGRVAVFIDARRFVVGCNHGDVLVLGVDGERIATLRSHTQAVYGAGA